MSVVHFLDDESRRESKGYEQREATRGEKHDDVSGNWEPVPEFGRYESITRIER